MSSFSHLQSFRLNLRDTGLSQSPARLEMTPDLGASILDHDSHPPLSNLALLIFEAVLSVVCISLPGYILARRGHFDAGNQKFLANLNVNLFTPCLIFTRLASQLNARKLSELGIIPVIFVLQTAVSWGTSLLVSKAFRFNRRAANFVTAMAVFGNSSSLPINLVLSLSQTIKGLHWDRIPGDNDDEVAARGILYLLIFQQLGQLVRWSWGFHVLLAPKDKYPEYRDDAVEEGRYGEAAALIEGQSVDDDVDAEADAGVASDSDGKPNRTYRLDLDRHSDDEDRSCYDPAGRTPVASASRASPCESDNDDDDGGDVDDATRSAIRKKKALDLPSNPLWTHPPRRLLAGSDREISSFPRIRSVDDSLDEPSHGSFWQRVASRCRAAVRRAFAGFYRKIPDGIREPAEVVVLKTYGFLYDFMNPPLWAMLLAVVVASVPSLQKDFFEEETFVANTISSAVRSAGNVAAPLILVTLGANLARNTQKQENIDQEEAQIGRKLLVASLLGRMLLPALVMAPILALMAKYVPISILDDPIFVIVCFLLTGAPSALQLAQICQLNGVFEGVMADILFYSYVIWILPSTLLLVLCALEVVEWAL